MQKHSGCSPGGAAPASYRESTCLKAMLLATFLTAAFVGLKVGQLADTGTHGSSQAARRAAVHLKRRLEEGTEMIEEEGAVRRTPDLFILQPGGKVLLPGSVDSRTLLPIASKARIMPRGLTSGNAAAVMIQRPGQAKREAWPSFVPQGPGPGELTGLSAARAARASALTSVAPDFDWHMYLLYHPELRGLGVDSDELAREHYMHQGRAQVPILFCDVHCLDPGYSVSMQPATQPAIATCRSVLFACLRLVWFLYSLSACRSQAAALTACSSSAARGLDA